MPRYLVERSFPERLGLDHGGHAGCAALIDADAQRGVTWLHSYVTPDRHHAYCIYDGPSPEAIRVSAGAQGLSVDRITEVQMLDPYFLQ